MIKINGKTIFEEKDWKEGFFTQEDEEGNKNYFPNKHWDVCKKAELLIQDIVYRHFKRNIQPKMLPLYRAIVSFVDEQKPIKVRQFFYYAISNNIIPYPKNSKDAENKCKGLGSLLVRLRLGGVIPMDSVVDDTDLIGTPQYEDISIPIRNSIEYYRGDWWKEQPYYVEVWLEKKSLAMTIAHITNKYGVYLSVAGKYPTLSQINNAKGRFKFYKDKPIIILYFGDLNPSGKDMPRYLGKRLKELRVHNVTIIEVALNVNDIKKYNLLRNPFKSKDTREKWYIEKYGINYSVELDALNPNILRQKVEDSILQYVDVHLINKCIKRDKQAKDKALSILDKANITTRGDMN